MAQENKIKKPKRETVDWWLKWIRGAKRAAKRSWDDTQAAYDEFERMSRDKDSESTGGVVRRGYPIYTISCKLLEAAYFSKNPKVRSKRQYGIEDEMALTMALICDRLGQYNIDHGRFCEGMLAARGDYIHGSKATAQVIYKTSTEQKRMPLNLDPITNEYSDPATGKVYEGEVFRDDDGDFYNGDVAIESTQQIIFAPCPFDDVIHTPQAKCQGEITEQAYKFQMDYAEAEERFNPNKDRQLPYKSGKDFDAEDSEVGEDENKNDRPGRYLEGWECYDLKSRKIYWVCEDFKDDFLGSESDPYGLKGFFPSPDFIISNKSRKSLYPTPTWVYLETTADQLHNLYYRMFRLIDSIKRKALVYGLSNELIAALNKLDGEEYITIGDIEGILEKGGLEKYVQWIPVAELVEALSEAVKVEEHFKALFYEWYRLPDVMRGISDPQQTAAAAELTSDTASDSFQADKLNIYTLARDGAEMMLDMSLKVYSDEKIARICGFQHMTPEHQQRFPEALARLRNDEERIIRIDFETDSMSFRDDAKELERQNLIAKVTLEGLAMVGRMEHPQFIAAAIQTVLSVIEAMNASSQSEDSIKRAVKMLEEAKNVPPPPPPPDYEGMKIEMQGQKNQISAQKDQMDAAAKQRELDQKEFKLIQDEKQQQFEQQLAAVQEQREQENQSFTQQLSAFQAKLDQALVAIEQQRVELDEAKGVIQAQESMMEEQRLAKEVDNTKEISEADIVARVLEVVAAQTPEAPKEDKKEKPTIPNVTIVNEARRGGWKMKHSDGTETTLEPSEN